MSQTPSHKWLVLTSLYILANYSKVFHDLKISLEVSTLGLSPHSFFNTGTNNMSSS